MMAFQPIFEIALEMCLCLSIKIEQEKQIIMNSELEGIYYSIIACSHLQSYWEHTHKL